MVLMKVAINGFGRIGRLVGRIIFDDSSFEVVAINDLGKAEDLAYLLKYDSTHGRYKEDSISYEENNLIVDGKKILVLNEKDPTLLPWKDLGVELVFECSGVFTSREKASAHLKGGAKKVIISAPAGDDVKTVVFGANEEILDGSEDIISAASCTTNCLATVLKVIEDAIGIEKGFMTTVHAYTNDQVTLDVAHKKGIYSRRGRAAAQNIVPTSTGAASAIGLVLPSLDKKLDGIALRAPVPDGSVIDLVLELKRNITVEEINALFKEKDSDVLKYTEDPIVSSDVIGTHYGALFDSLSTSIVEVDGKQLVKVIAWYDNEMGYSAQMVRTAKYFCELVGD
jgi:glyceraldehyde 3-phosphate dehydrogenase